MEESWKNRKRVAKPFAIQNADPTDPDAVFEELKAQIDIPFGEMKSVDLDREEKRLVNDKGNVVSYNARSQRNWDRNVESQIIANADTIQAGFDRRFDKALDTSKQVELVEEVTSSAPSPQNSNSLLPLINFPGKVLRTITTGAASLLYRAVCNVTLYQGSSEEQFDHQQVSFTNARDTSQTSSSSSSSGSRQTSSNAAKDEFAFNVYFDNKESFDKGGVSAEECTEFIKEAGFDESWMSGLQLQKKIWDYRIPLTNERRREIWRYNMHGTEIGKYKLIEEKGGDKSEEYSRAIITLLFIYCDEIQRTKSMTCLGSWEEIVLSFETLFTKEFTEEMLLRLEGSRIPPKEAKDSKIWFLLKSIISNNKDTSNDYCYFKHAARKLKIPEFKSQTFCESRKVQIESAKSRNLPIFHRGTSGGFRVLMNKQTSKLNHHKIYMAIGKSKNYNKFKDCNHISFCDAFGSLAEFYKLFKDKEELETILEAFNGSRTIPTSMSKCKLATGVKKVLEKAKGPSVVIGHVERANEYEDMKKKIRAVEESSTSIIAEGSNVSTTTASSQSIKRETSSDDDDDNDNIEMAQTLVPAPATSSSSTTTASSQSIKRETSSDNDDDNIEMAQTLVCPNGLDPDVFFQLPQDMQQEVIDISIIANRSNVSTTASSQSIKRETSSDDDNDDIEMAQTQVINLCETSDEEEDTKPAAESRNNKKRSITNGALPSTKRNTSNSTSFSRPRSNIITKQEKELKKTISDGNQIQYICELLNITFTDGKPKATSLLIKKLAELSKDELVFKFNEVFEEEVLPNDESYVETIKAILNFLENQE